MEYIMWLHNFFSTRGYCSLDKPKLVKRSIEINNKVYFHYRFRTWSYSSFNWIHEAFYKEGIKFIPNNIDQFLTPLTLAI